jgi:REP element-mobilizing transposase RayT
MTRRVQTSPQQALPFKSSWGGSRAGAGRKRLPRRKGVAHRTREDHRARFPVHVTLRAGRRLPSLRKQSIFNDIFAEIGLASHAWFRVLHFSVQVDHMHLVVEAHDKVCLRRGMAGLAIRVARAINRRLRRRGRFWGDRYHARELRTPREVRNGIVYVLMNRMKHVPTARGMDDCSSWRWFDGWRLPPISGPPGVREARAPVRAPRTWLAREGWRRHGLLSSDERPKAPREGPRTEEWTTWVASEFDVRG